MPPADGRTDRIHKINTSLIGRGKNKYKNSKTEKLKNLPEIKLKEMDMLKNTQNQEKQKQQQQHLNTSDKFNI